jgi:uncharacterized SAM-binding protein YcdF (DUF218 family)
LKFRIFFIGIIIIFLLLFVGSCRNAGKWLIKDDDPVRGDAMIVLMGGITDRILHAVDLFNEDISNKILIVKESMGPSRMLEERGVRITSSAMNAKRILNELGVPADSIVIFPCDATSTQMEATILRDQLKNKPEIDSLIIVSSSEHMRRASMIFERAFAKAGIKITVLCSPSEYTGFDGKVWWRSKEGIQTVLMEYLKIANFLLFDGRKL